MSKKLTKQFKTKNAKLKKQNDELSNVLADLALESYRFSTVFQGVLNKLDSLEAGASKRYERRFKFFLTKLNENLERAEISIQDFTNQEYDAGLPITAMNIADFANYEGRLYIEQMLEPVLIKNGKVLRTGTVILKGKNNE